MQKTYHAIGLMSGSSLDGLDIVFSRFDTRRENTAFAVEDWQLIAAATCSFTDQWKIRLRDLPAESAYGMAATHAAFGDYMGRLVNRFLVEKGIPASSVDLIASHGHTVFHEPQERFTAQIGDGAALSAITGCTVVADFRTADVALGGQGAPLAPVADKMLFPGYDFYLNLGGIANLSARTGDRWIAFDVCGANQILNALAFEKGLPYDSGGMLASTGKTDLSLLERQKELDFFKSPYPKSLSNQWVRENQVQAFAAAGGKTEDKLHTACELTAILLSKAIGEVAEKEGMSKNGFRMLVTGGGAFNDFLAGRIRYHVQKHGVEIDIPDDSIVAFKEALLMALMGVLRMEKVPNTLSTVTGAPTDVTGGAVWVSAGK